MIKYSDLDVRERALLDSLKDKMVKKVLPYDQRYAKNWEFFETVHSDYLDDFQALISDEMDVKAFVSTYHLDYYSSSKLDEMYDEYYEIFPPESGHDDIIRRNQITFIENWDWDDEIKLPDKWDCDVYDAIVESVKDKAVSTIRDENWERFRETARKMGWFF